MKVKFAGLKIQINNKYKFIEEYCKDYITDDEETDMEISLTDEEIKAEGTDDYDIGYLESLAIYRKIADALPSFDGFLVHGSLISVDGIGILFMAKSGVGKTTHTMLWKELCGDSLKIINGDKPIIRIIDDKVYGFGTPFSGKEGFNLNECVEIKDICFIERGDTNYVEKCDDVLQRLLNQVYASRKIGIYSTVPILSKFVEKLKFYVVHCNVSLVAAKTAKSFIFKNH